MDVEILIFSVYLNVLMTYTFINIVINIFRKYFECLFISVVLGDIIKTCMNETHYSSQHRCISRLKFFMEVATVSECAFVCISEEFRIKWTNVMQYSFHILCPFTLTTTISAQYRSVSHDTFRTSTNISNDKHQNPFLASFYH